MAMQSVLNVIALSLSSLIASSALADSSFDLDWSAANTIVRWCSDEGNTVRIASGNLTNKPGYHRCSEADRSTHRDATASPFTVSKLANLTLTPEVEPEVETEAKTTTLPTGLFSGVAEKIGGGYQGYFDQLQTLLEDVEPTRVSKKGSSRSQSGKSSQRKSPPPNPQAISEMVKQLGSLVSQ